MVPQRHASVHLHVCLAVEPTPAGRARYSLSTQWVNSHVFILDLTVSAGTYIKELVHGDLGRTTPNLGASRPPRRHTAHTAHAHRAQTMRTARPSSAGTLLGGNKCDLVQLDVADIIYG